MNASRLAEHLKQLEQDIAASREHVKVQRTLVARLTIEGDDAASALELLRAMEDSLAIRKRHQAFIKAKWNTFAKQRPRSARHN